MPDHPPREQASWMTMLRASQLQSSSATLAHQLHPTYPRCLHFRRSTLAKASTAPVLRHRTMPGPTLQHHTASMLLALHQETRPLQQCTIPSRCMRRCRTESRTNETPGWTISRKMTTISTVGTRLCRWMMMTMGCLGGWRSERLDLYLPGFRSTIHSSSPSLLILIASCFCFSALTSYPMYTKRTHVARYLLQASSLCFWFISLSSVLWLVLFLDYYYE